METTQKINVPGQAQEVYVPLFLKDIPENIKYFLSYDAAKMNAEKTKMYLDPYGYASTEQTDGFVIGVEKSGDKWILEKSIIFPTITKYAPIDWYSVTIVTIDADEYTNEEDEDELDEEAFAKAIVKKEMLTLDEQWGEFNCNEAIGCLTIFLLSLERSKVLDIAGSEPIRAMTKKTISILHQETNSQKINELLTFIWNEISHSLSTAKVNDGQIKLGPDSIAILEKIQKVADQRLVTLFTPKTIKTTIPIEDLPLDDISKKLDGYTIEELTDYINRVSNEELNEDSDYAKAGKIRDYLTTKKSIK